jgi:hypothetical protein
MRTRTGAAIVVLALLSAGCEWAQWGANPSHTGSTEEPSITAGSLAEYEASTIGSLPTSTQAVTANGLVFAAEDGQLTAFDTITHAIVWTGALPPGATAGGALAIDPASNTVFVLVAGTGPLLLGFDVDGFEHCNSQLNTCTAKFVAQVGTTAGFASPVVVADGRVFANGGDGVAAFDAAGVVNCVPFIGTQACSPLWSAPADASGSGTGPAVSDGRLFDPVPSTGGTALGAFDAATGASLWSAPLGGDMTAPPSVGLGGMVFVPVDGTIKAIPAAGCGAPVCSSWFDLVREPSDAAGNFLGTPAIDDGRVYATNANGSLYSWAESGCGALTCEPALAIAVNTPVGGSTAYAQSAAVTDTTVFLLAQRAVAAANHVFLVALNGLTGTELGTWDLKPGGFGAGRAAASIANGVIYAPVDTALFAVHPPPVEPVASLNVSGLTLQPAFDPSIHDYALRCAAGGNSVTLSMTAEPGGSVRVIAPFTTQPRPSRTLPLALTGNQAVVVEGTDADGAAAQYWIRCLPSDFPAITATPHPAAGEPTPGWYIAGNLVAPVGTGSYAMILDRYGTPVWYKRSPIGTANNVHSPKKNTIVFAAQPVRFGFSVDPNATFSEYTLDTGQVRNFKTVGMPTDFHDLQTLPNGNLLLMSYPFKSGVDLTGLPGNPAPGSNETIADCVIQEVTPAGQLVWDWAASEHSDIVAENISPTPINVNGTTVYDVFHCNSIDATASGDVLVSHRHLSAVYLISRADENVIWKVGGTSSTPDGGQYLEIQNDPLAFFQQHDARLLANGHLTVFDNQNIGGPPARGIEYVLDVDAGTADKVFEYLNPNARPSAATGSFRRYSDGHTVIGWGIDAIFSGAVLTEIDADSNNVLDISFTGPNSSYRGLKVPPPRFDVNVLRLTAGH